jgi:hypothetical protein
MALRPQDPVPEWITHLAKVEGPLVETGRRESLHHPAHVVIVDEAKHSDKKPRSAERSGKVLVDMKSVNVRYHERHVSTN